MSFILNHLLQAGLTTTLAVGFFVWILRKHLSSYLGEKGRIRAQIEDIQKTTRLEQAARQEFLEGNAYLTEKGKQAATKEDIEQITRQIESVRTEHLSLLELLKLELSKRGTIHRLRMEKEFETLSLAWDAVAELRFATEGLFPSGIQPRLEDDERRVQATERAEAFYRAYDACQKAINKNRPFFPDDLDKLLFKVVQKAQEVHAHFSNGINVETGEIPPRVFENARREIDSLHTLVNDASLQIRGHISI